MKKILLLICVIAATSITTAFAAGISFCLTNSYSERTTLTVSGYSAGKILVSGAIDYSPYGGTVWPVSGTYTIATHTLAFTATNPDPDNCTYWANSVNFSYAVLYSTIVGGFANDCGVSGSLTASATYGSCPSVTPSLKKNEIGTSGSHIVKRTQLPVPPGQSLDEILKVNTISVTPNPVSRIANIKVTMASTTKATINVYNKQGALVYTVADAVIPAGKHEYTWNLQTKNGNAKSDYYVVKLITKEGEQASAKIIVVQ